MSHNPSSRKSLNDRQRRFAEFVATGSPATLAYAKAGFSGGKNAEANACRLMENDGVKAYLAQLRAEQAKDGFLTREDIRRKRFEMVDDPKTPAAVIAQLLRDEARMMGWDEPERSDDKLTINFVKNW